MKAFRITVLVSYSTSKLHFHVIANNDQDQLNNNP